VLPSPSSNDRFVEGGLAIIAMSARRNRAPTLAMSKSAGIAKNFESAARLFACCWRGRDTARVYSDARNGLVRSSLQRFIRRKRPALRKGKLEQRETFQGPEGRRKNTRPPWRSSLRPCVSKRWECGGTETGHCMAKRFEGPVGPKDGGSRSARTAVAPQFEGELKRHDLDQKQTL